MGYLQRRYVKHLLLVLCWWFGHALAWAQPINVVDLKEQPLVLSSHVQTLEDAGKELSLADVHSGKAAAQFKGDLPNLPAIGFGYSKSAHWLKLVLDNPSEKRLDRLLELGSPSIEYIRFYTPDASGTYVFHETGSVLPFSTRLRDTRSFVFPVTLEPRSSQVVYFRLQSLNPITTSLKLWTPSGFGSYERTDYFGHSWYFGIASAMVFFNLLLFVSLRDLIYLRYVAFTGSMALALACQSGLFKEFVLNDTPWWSTYGVMLSFCLTLVFALEFMRHMLNTKATVPRLHLISHALGAVLLVGGVALLFNFGAVIRPLTSMYGASALFILLVGLCCMWKGQRSAYFFSAAFFMLCAAGVLSTLRALGVMQPNFFTENALRIGSAFEMLLLAFALADRFNVMRREKAQAQRDAFVAQNKLVETLQASERLLEERVVERTAELDRKNNDLKLAMASREDVERIARHDIKTPLGGLAAAPAMLRAGRTMSEQEETVLKMMEKAANRALDMVNLSLDLYQMENGTYRFHAHTVNLGELVQSVLQDLTVHAKSKSVRTAVLGIEEPVYVRGDDALCYSIVANLTKNAIEAAPEHTAVVITLTPGAKVQLSIQNQGAVPEALRATFFDKYSTAGKVGGTGLGTYSSQLLAKVQGGSLAMHTGDEEGTTLTLELSRAPTPPTLASISSGNTLAMQAALPTPELPAMSVLVVDDDEFNLMVMSSHLPQPPLHVTTAVNGRLALESAMQQRPDIIILDIEMPIMGGLEAMSRIRQYQEDAHQSPSYFVAYSGSDDAQSTAKFLQLGFDKCLKKPSSRYAILAMLAQVKLRAENHPTNVAA
ncbi:hybrid sensor histidine kinase/response regulator [Rhodoferax aquaticus]|uniref:histidine kinase n=1 Tax=Rhodoferax aquaticus TaxID=2527691 RepID=A0A515EPB4_9BURK|nr:7TM diverse intracellular signaling domain-containing protein [Rhodoferax aquaticus]QDL54489.1 hybrid sensor histidine kinase/response regulator [Rhodoferax aquaticus]